MRRDALILMSLLLVLCASTPALASGPIWVFSQFQESENYREAKTFLTAAYRKSLESRLSPKQLDALIERDRMVAYAAQTRGLGGDRALLVASDITFLSDDWNQLPENERSQLRLGYEFVQHNGQWLIDKRFDPDAIVLKLLEQPVIPANFNSNNHFAMGQQLLMAHGAFAYWFNANTIRIDFYRDELSTADLKRLAYGRKVHPAEREFTNDAVESETSQPPPRPHVWVAVTVDATRHLTAWSMAYAHFAAQELTSESVSQMRLDQLTEVALEGRRLRLNGEGSLPGETGAPSASEQGPSLLWRLDLDLEVFERGL